MNKLELQMSNPTGKIRSGERNQSKGRQRLNEAKLAERDWRIENEVEGLFRRQSRSPWSSIRISGVRYSTQGGPRPIGITKDLDNDFVNRVPTDS